ncbi:MAG: LamG domain-containing protein [Verrucomicrobiota bacterium]
MRVVIPCLFLLPCFISAATLQETWETGYAKADTSGPQVLGYWKFDAEAALKDSSGKGHDLTLHGTKSRDPGKFGGALESFPGFPIDDKKHAALTANKPALSPKGAFTLEMWIKPKADWLATQRCYLLDKKYVDHTDYAWQITDADKGGSRRLFVTLGFGAESKSIYSEPVQFGSDWQHVAFVYDGDGDGQFYRNGSRIGGLKLAGYGAITPGTKALSIGDRIGSNYGGFPGFIDELRISDGALKFERASLTINTPRSVWRRMETNVKPVEIICTNLQREPLKAAKLKLSFGGKDEEFILPDLKPGAEHVVKLTPDTKLKPGRYTLIARFEAGEYSNAQSTTVEIVPRLAPRMPVVMWGANGAEIARLKDIGFTHFIGLRDAGSSNMWAEKKQVPAGTPEDIAARCAVLDEALRNGLEVVASLSPSDPLKHDPKNLRVNREGKVYERQDICASIPEFAAFYQTVGQSIAKTFGDHPAYTSTLINTEVRDHNAPSFNPIDIENYRKFANAEIPAEVMNKWGVDHTKLKDFPVTRVIPDEHPILKYYRWFWTVGDGWNGLHTALHKGVKSNGRRDHWTFFDPAVRQPSISGAGGGVDVLSHWTYTYPDPQRIGLATDQLFAMSEASGKGQKVMKMTQIIWYRSQTAPIGAKGPGELVAWQDHDPDAAYITIAPMHLREAFWTKMARPIQGIMYHGWESLVDNPGSTSSYRFTNPNTVHVLRELIHDVTEPLGPTLMKIPAERSEVAMLESFTSQMFARRGGYGSNMNRAADLWQAMQHAHVQIDILFEETLLKSGLSGRKILLMPECDVLTEGVVKKIQDWQKRGGKVIADEFLAPGLKADLVIPSLIRVKNAAKDKAAVMALAKTLPEKMQALGWKPALNIDNPEIILRTRRSGDTLYVFAINDQREPGTYVGQHGLVMENGLPSSGIITLQQDNASVYDLTTHVLIVPKRGPDGGLSWPVDLGPGGGRIFMITPKPLLQLALDVPATATCGNVAKVRATLSTTDASAISAIVPIQVSIEDANGVAAEGSGYYAAEKGVLEVSLDLAPNEDPGTWQIRVRELASGMESVKWMKVSNQIGTP